LESRGKQKVVIIIIIKREIIKILNRNIFIAKDFIRRKNIII